MAGPERAWHIPVSQASFRPDVTVRLMPIAAGCFLSPGLMLSKSFNGGAQPSPAG